MYETHVPRSVGGSAQTPLARCVNVVVWIVVCARTKPFDSIAIHEFIPLVGPSQEAHVVSYRRVYSGRTVATVSTVHGVAVGRDGGAHANFAVPILYDCGVPHSEQVLCVYNCPPFPCWGSVPPWIGANANGYPLLDEQEQMRVCWFAKPPFRLHTSCIPGLSFVFAAIVGGSKDEYIRSPTLDTLALIPSWWLETKCSICSSKSP